MTYNEGSLHRAIAIRSKPFLCTLCGETVADGTVYWVYPKWKADPDYRLGHRHCEDCLLAAGGKRFYHVWYTVYSRSASDPDDADKDPATLIDTPRLHVALDAIRSAERILSGILIDPGVEIGGLRQWGGHLWRGHGGANATFPPDILERAELERAQHDLHQTALGDALPPLRL